MAGDRETKCPRCGKTVSSEATRCWSCGEDLSTGGELSRTEAPRRSPVSAAPAGDAEMLFEGRDSALTLVRPAVVPALLIAGASVFWAAVGGAMDNGAPRRLVAAVSLTVIIVAVLRCLLVWLAFWNRKYTVTSDRVEHESGVLRKSSRNMDLWRVREVACERTFVERVFGLGRVVIVSLDTAAARVVVGPIRQARQLYDKLKKAQLEADRRRGAARLE